MVETLLVGGCWVGIVLVDEFQIFVEDFLSVEVFNGVVDDVVLGFPELEGRGSCFFLVVDYGDRG